MALVAYDWSDCSDDDDSDPGNKKISENVENDPNRSLRSESETTLDEPVNDEEVEVLFKASKKIPLQDETSSEEEDEQVQVSFSKLPTPNYHAFSADEIKIKNLKLTSLSKVIPMVQTKNSRSQPRENGKKLNFQKESGLLSVLPKPANETSEINKMFKLPSKLIPAAAKASSTSATNVKKPQVTKMNDEDEDIGTDFFSLSKENVVEPHEDIDIDLPDIGNNDSTNNIPGPRPLFIPSIETNTTKLVAVPETEENSQNLSELDKDLLQKLCGRKRKGQVLDDIQLIDINEAEILAESKKISEKHFTDEVMCNPAPSRCSSSSLSKRKHQITYLAFQARERELELKNQWAQNRATRKQTQSKYGF